MDKFREEFNPEIHPIQKIKGKSDFVRLINYLRLTNISGNIKPIPLKHFTFYANHLLSPNRFESFEIVKKNGGNRTIHAPKRGLKSILTGLNLFFKQHYKTHPNVTGFAEGKSIVDNAKPHIGKKYVLNIDLKDFFHAFERKHVKWAMMNAPFFIKEEKEPLAFFIASLCTHPIEINGETKFILPQGSPCSPILTNLLCRRLDKQLKNLAQEYQAKYTRYADDITFSSNHHKISEKDFYNKLEYVISNHNHQINTKKVRLQKEGYKQEVTGIIVNEKPNLPKRYIKQLRMWLAYWEKYGYLKADKLFKNDYLKERGHRIEGTPHLLSVMDGKLQFLKMVKGDKDPTYKKLESRFHKLNGDKKLTQAHLELMKINPFKPSLKNQQSLEEVLIKLARKKIL
ncbi:reverse transcriptase family protein [Belliella aquatica]|uniref:RNA-directed DNA polymerase n=1 Tax=Belliella aquatica TaxID=1323734 RepID=A0ABQ1N491_9BACT|nr:reverse transcriptase family protein [Belliella aquatica]MCH7407390.1 reverse transcriptase family protein [Belliella aquatica]GGC53298.1 hypothetical protein GCM10010993_34690 [Belliella aquatica]